MIRKLMAAVAVLVLLAIAAWIFIWRTAPEVHVDISQAELQSRLAGRFPLKNCSLIVACLEIANPKVVLTNGSDRIGVTADLAANIGQRSMPGSVAFSAKPRYVAGEGKFFLDDVQIDELRLTGFPPDFAEVVKARGPAILRAVLQSYPVYTIKGDDTRQALVKYALRKVEVVDGKVRVTFARPRIAEGL